MCGTRRAAAAAIAVGLVLSLGACGAGGISDPPPPTPPPPTPTPAAVVAQGNGLALESGYIGWLEFTTSRTGNLDLTVDWTFATDDIDVALARGSCDGDRLEAGQCTIAVYSVSETAKPERLRLDNAAPATYTLFVENTGDRDESISYQVVLTPTTASGGVPPATSSVRELSNPLGQKQQRRGFVPLR